MTKYFEHIDEPTKHLIDGISVATYLNPSNESKRSY